MQPADTNWTTRWVAVRTVQTRSIYATARKNGVQRYKCKSCKRGFTEYTGTWMAGLQRRDKVGEYLELMIAEESLDKISQALEINKKTAFDWRHKIFTALGSDEGGLIGITESDEFFFSVPKRVWT